MGKTCFHQDDVLPFDIAGSSGWRSELKSTCVAVGSGNTIVKDGNGIKVAVGDSSAGSEVKVGVNSVSLGIGDAVRTITAVVVGVGVEEGVGEYSVGVRVGLPVTVWLPVTVIVNVPVGVSLTKAEVEGVMDWVVVGEAVSVDCWRKRNGR